METAGLMPVRVLEHFLPTAIQTHELCFVHDADGPDGAGSLLLSQMEEGRLLKMAVNPDNGELSTYIEGATFAPEGTVTSARSGLPFVGLHGLSRSSRPGKAWMTLQYINEVVLVDVETMAVEVAIPCPVALSDGRGPIGGPHTVREANGQLFVCLKGGASCHYDANAKPDAAQLAGVEEATTHALWRVALDEDMQPVDEGTIFEAPATPVMCVVTTDGTCWVACDASPTLFAVPASATSVMECTYHQLPYQYAMLQQTGPGIVIGPDDRPWFCVLNGNGLIGRVSCCGKLQMFELLKTFNPSQRICHLSFDREGVLYAISSDLLDPGALNTLIRCKFDATFTHIIAQHEIAFPSQQTAVHRICHLNGGDNPSVLVSELSKSKVLQIFKKGLPPLEQFPTKTMEVTTRRVFDAAAPCPRGGNALCHCSADTGATIPTESFWLDEKADEVFDEALTPSIRELTPVTDPRTGEELLEQDLSRGIRADSAFSKFWSFGIKGHQLEDVPTVTMYSSNGSPGAASDQQPARLGATHDVLLYKPEYLKALIEREPWRKAQLLDELVAAGVLNDISQEWTSSYEPSSDADLARYDALLDERISSAPVVMFSFTTCRYCKLAKEALDAKQVSYTTVELDAEADGDGAALRARLVARTGRSSMPNIWVGGEFVGGLNDGPGILPLDARGELEPKLRAAGALAVSEGLEGGVLSD